MRILVVNDDGIKAPGLPETEAADGTDAGAALSNYISIGTIRNMIL